jgi:hypothetical protein
MTQRPMSLKRLATRFVEMRGAWLALEIFNAELTPLVNDGVVSQLLPDFMRNVVHDLVLLRLITILEEAFAIAVRTHFPNQKVPHTLHKMMQLLNQHGYVRRFDDLMQFKRYRNVSVHLATPVLGIDMEWALDLVEGELRNLGVPLPPVDNSF